jgi:hypothetical protein
MMIHEALSAGQSNKRQRERESKEVRWTEREEEEELTQSLPEGGRYGLVADFVGDGWMEVAELLSARDQIWRSIGVPSSERAVRAWRERNERWLTSNRGPRLSKR